MQSSGEDGCLAVDYFTFSSSIADNLRSASLVISHAGTDDVQYHFLEWMIFDRLKVVPLTVKLNFLIHPKKSRHEQILKDELHKPHEVSTKYTVSPAANSLEQTNSLHGTVCLTFDSILKMLWIRASGICHLYHFSGCGLFTSFICCQIPYFPWVTYLSPLFWILA